MGDWTVGGRGRSKNVGAGEKAAVQRILDGKKRGAGLFEGKAGGEGEGVGDEIDLWDNVELGFPVEGEVEGGVLEFVVQAYDASGAEPGVVVFKSYIAACTIEPGESRRTADKLMFFVQGADPKPVAK